MRPARRLVVLLTGVLLGLLAQVATAWAAAGGGSGGFGGGGGGGGGGGFGGGGGGYGGGGGGTVSGTGLLIIGGGVVVVLVFSAIQEKRKATFSRGYAKMRDRVTAAARRRRAEEVARTALVAAEDDPAFAEDRVRDEAEALFLAIQDAWSRDDRDALDRMVAPDMMVEWRLRLEDFASRGWRNHVDVRSSSVEYVGITNRASDEEDRCVVRVSAELDDYVIDGSGGRIEHTGNAGGETSLREYWTLGKRDGHWTLLSIEQDEEGEHQLAEPMEADPSEDARLTDEARVEQAVADRLPEGYTTAEVADEDAGDAEQRLRDMSLNDERFDPDIVEAAVRRGVAAWAQAVDGDDAEFAHVAQPELLRQLLYPSGDGTRSLRVVVRAPVVRKVTFTGLDTSSEPATVTVHMQLEGVRYVEDRNTLTLVGGSKDRPTRFDGTWTLALDGAPDVPWRIARVRDDMPPS